MSTPPATCPPAMRRRLQAEVHPHVELDLLRHPQPAVEQVGPPVAGPRPRLGLEFECPARCSRPELDLAGFQMPVQRAEPEARSRHGGSPARARPRGPASAPGTRRRRAACPARPGSCGRRRRSGRPGSGRPAPRGSARLGLIADPWTRTRKRRWNIGPTPSRRSLLLSSTSPAGSGGGRSLASPRVSVRCSAVTRQKYCQDTSSTPAGRRSRAPARRFSAGPRGGAAHAVLPCPS